MDDYKREETRVLFSREINNIAYLFLELPDGRIGICRWNGDEFAPWISSDTIDHALDACAFVERPCVAFNVL